VPAAVLLDVGGVFFVPEHSRIVAAFARAGVAVPAAMLDRAHYAGARAFPVQSELEWASAWRCYLEGYIAACGVPDDRRDEVHAHLDSEFADAALWVQELPDARAGLQRLAATGVRLGIVSNADGLIGSRLAAAGILQVGPGIGTAVECLVDSGAVGVTKPDPRIFRIALEAMDLDPDDVWYVGDMPGIDVVGARAAGLRPFLMDPFDLNGDADYDRIASLGELAALLA